MKQIIFIVAVCLLTLTTTFACSCEYQGPFVKMAQRTPLVALVKVTKHLTFKDIYHVKTPMSMEVEIIDIYKGQETRKTIVVWGDIGNLCRPYLSRFKEGEYFVIAFDKGATHGKHPDEKETDYTISICGEHWLLVDYAAQTATGDVGGQRGIELTIALAELKERVIKND